MPDACMSPASFLEHSGYPHYNIFNFLSFGYTTFVNAQSAVGFCGISMTIFYGIAGPCICHGIIENQWNMPNFSVSTVSADGLAPCGARTSAGIVMTKFKS